MNYFLSKKYVCKSYILFLIAVFCNINVYSQEKIRSFDLFTRETANTSITKINTNTDKLLLLEENFSPCKSFNIIFISKDTFQIDTVENFLVKYVEDETEYDYYPVITANSVFYIKDTLFVSFGKGVATYTKRVNHFILDNIEYFSNNKIFKDIVGEKDGRLIIGNQYFSSSEYYELALYNIKTNEIQKIIQKDMGNSIMLHYYEIYNAFASNNKYISLMNTIEPKVYLYDYDLNAIDSINFSFNNNYKTTKNIIDTNFSINSSIVNLFYPKNIIILLDNINVLNLYSNTKQMFVNDSTLLILTMRMREDSCDLIKVNTHSKQSNVLLSFPKSGFASPYTALSIGSTMPLSSKGYFFDYNTQLDGEQENIIYSLDLYYSKVLNFNSNILSLEDRKGVLIKVDLQDYDGVIIFDEYLCKTCFAKELKDAKLLFIYHNSNIDKVNRLTWYRTLKKIYPNSEILFNSHYQFNTKKNITTNIF